MMHRCCGSSQGHVMGATCTCGSSSMFHNQTNSSYSMLFSMPNNHHIPYHQHHDYDQYDSRPFTPSSSSSYSPVDCTLSLGTPSTRLTEDEEKRNRHEQRRSSLSNFSWNNNSSKSQTKSNRGSNGGSFNNDPLLARRCANCDTTSTPLWRNGPRGPKSLCNACGIRYKKEERRANAAAATSAAATGGVIESSGVYNDSWYAQPPQMRFVDDSDGDSENGIPNFLSWRLNVTDRTSFVHDFTM